MLPHLHFLPPGLVRGCKNGLQTAPRRRLVGCTLTGVVVETGVDVKTVDADEDVCHEIQDGGDYGAGPSCKKCNISSLSLCGICVGC